MKEETTQLSFGCLLPGKMMTSLKVKKESWGSGAKLVLSMNQNSNDHQPPEKKTKTFFSFDPKKGKKLILLGERQKAEFSSFVFLLKGKKIRKREKKQSWMLLPLPGILQFPRTSLPHCNSTQARVYDQAKKPLEKLIQFTMSYEIACDIR